MRGFSSFFGQASKALHDYSAGSGLLLMLSAVSGGGGGGGHIAHLEPQTEHGTRNIDQQLEPKKKRVVVLGTGWAGISFLKKLDISSFDVQVVSPHNYFTFTPLLPSVTCGTVEPRSIVEPIRNIIKKNTGTFHYWQADCVKIDPSNKTVLCRCINNANLMGNKELLLEYDYLVIAVGAQANNSKTSGVTEYCHFMKEIEDAQKIRRSLIACFERAALPGLNEEEKQAILHFVIVGGGPASVAFAAELHDFVLEDLVKLYPRVQDLVKITLIQSEDHILNTFDKRISSFAEQKFQRDGIEVQTGRRVLSVSDKAITMKAKSNGEISSVPYGMVVWSTGVEIRPVVGDFMEQIGQKNKRALSTNEWLRVKGCDDVYALGDCATIDQRKVMADISNIFKKADKDNSGTLTVKEFQDVIDDIRIIYPQVDQYLKSKRVRNMVDLLKDSEGSDGRVMDIETFTSVLSQADLKMKSLPATAQVAAQQGAYLARCFNHMEESKDNPEGPLHFEGSGHHQFRPFRYNHLKRFVSLGTEPVAILPWDQVIMGHSTRWLWYSVYAIEQVSWRTRLLVISDWTRRSIFGRDTSGI